MITGAILQKILLVEYIIVAIVYMIEGNYAKTLYWISACGITLAVLVMK